MFDVSGIDSFADSDDEYSKPYDSDDDEYYAAMMEKQMNLDDDGKFILSSLWLYQKKLDDNDFLV